MRNGLARHPRNLGACDPGDGGFTRRLANELRRDRGLDAGFTRYAADQVRRDRGLDAAGFTRYAADQVRRDRGRSPLEPPGRRVIPRPQFKAA